MSTTAGPTTPENPKTLLAHALELHKHDPDRPLPCDGEPFPDHADHDPDNRPAMTRRSGTGVDVADILARYFAEAAPDPARLAESVHRVGVPIYPSELMAEAAREAGRGRALETGRWLIRNGTDTCAVTVGLALLEAVGITAEDVGLVQTIGLLSDHFGPLAARALAKLPSGSAQALLWLADRAAGWGRVNVVRSLAGLDDPDTRQWLLRKAVDGDILNGYFIAVVVMTGRLHDVLDELAADPELTDCTGRILWLMTENEGMGLTLKGYEHADSVLRAHKDALSHHGPTLQRFYIAALIARYLGRSSPDDPNRTWEADRAAYRALLDEPRWREVALTGLAEGDGRIRFIADAVAPEIGLALGGEE